MAVAYRIVVYQAATALLIAAGLAWVSLDQGVAALLAGAVCVVPNGYYAWRISGERSPGRLLGLGVARVMVTLSLMAVAFATAKPAPLGFFVTFIAMQLMYVVGSVNEYGARAPARQAHAQSGDAAVSTLRKQDRTETR